MILNIKVLQERRIALISAAVTGKIDIREFAYQETA
jgi:type I restriction enzyme, S subunit